MAHDDVWAVFPRGWFAVGFSTEIPAGEPKALRYLGRHLVAFRGEDGAARVLDAHCPHMGAHLGVGGKIAGDCIRCPFHAWKFDGEGRCVEIPYARKIPPKARVGAWPVLERNGVVFVWHDREGGPPDWEIPALADHGSAAWLPWTTNRYTIRTHPREIVDNLADRAHFPAVHDTAIDDFEFSMAGHTATQRTRGRAFLPGGGVDQFASTTTYHGPGCLMMQMDGALSNHMLFAHTPVDHDTLELRMAVTLKVVGNAERTRGYVDHYMANLKAGFEDDIRIWEHKVWRDPPMLCDGDGPIGQLRRWYRQFYLPRTEV